MHTYLIITYYVKMAQPGTFTAYHLIALLLLCVTLCSAYPTSTAGEFTKESSRYFGAQGWQKAVEAQHVLVDQTTASKLQEDTRTSWPVED